MLKFNVPTSTTAYTFSGNQTVFAPRLNTSGGSVVLTGFAVNATFLLAQSAGAYAVTGYPGVLVRDFVNWLPKPVATDAWNGESQPSSLWSVVAQPAPTWTPDAVPSSSWSSSATPDNSWTTDPAQAIPPPVSE